MPTPKKRGIRAKNAQKHAVPPWFEVVKARVYGTTEPPTKYEEFFSNKGICLQDFSA